MFQRDSLPQDLSDLEQSNSLKKSCIALTEMAETHKVRIGINCNN